VVFPVLLPLFVVDEPVCLAVPEEPVEESLFVFEAVLSSVLSVLSAVFVADGLCVLVADWVAESVADPELLESVFCLTTKESISGNHLGQGQAAVKVERKRRTREHSWRFRAALMLMLLTPQILLFSAYIPTTFLSRTLVV